MHYEFLSLYSPDYNPIGLLFSTMKYCHQWHGSYICFAMNELSVKKLMWFLLKQCVILLYKMLGVGIIIVVMSKCVIL